jgi:hypothetical protein
MCKAAHPLGGVGSSNPRRWRGERLHHLCVFFDSLLISRMCPTYILEVLQSEPPMLAPYQGYKATHPNSPASWGGTGKKIY